MSAHVEWFNADDRLFGYDVVPAGTTFSGYDEPTDTVALVLGSFDNKVVIEGDPKVLAEILREAADQLYID